MSDKSSSNFRVFKKKVKIDRKGRVCLPYEIRKNLGLEKNSEILVISKLSENIVILLPVKGGDSK
ncbi:MAG: hypothetical protein J7K72_01610 [Candidatus Aenigmarchaeota archaeon]|nr:hypothetical protein [Candidatus Aenigmarchaeota archaeon]